MNNSKAQTPELKGAAPVAMQPAAEAKPGSSESTVVKANVVARALKTPTPAKLAPSKPVAKVLAPAPRKTPAKAKVTASPMVVATAAAAPVDKVRSPAKGAAKAEKAAADVRVPAESKTKPPGNEKKSKETKHAGKKPKLVRDSFTFPAADYALIGILKQRALKAGHEIKKSELLRAALFALSALSDPALIRALGGIVKLKPGRPAK